ncbi:MULTISPECIES: cobalamin biosynthesis protein [unclassified Saccharothrix]|uniref:cobalamin biosynthesis protein n=1 Tax=unclassified Saccharothrix TaxID=2593673 RepID=UPI00307EAFFF
MIGVFATGEPARRAAVELAKRLGPDAVVPDGPVRPALRRLWPRLGSAVFFLGTEAAVRLVAPLVRDERSDPGVVCVDGGFTVALLGGADALAVQIAELLDNTPVVTSTDVSPLDELVELLDVAVEGDLVACGEAVRGGEEVLLANPLGFPLPALPDNVLVTSDVRVHESAWTVLLDDRIPPGRPRDNVVRLVPRTLVVGIGSSSGVSAQAVSAVLGELETRGLDLRAVRAFATVDRKESEQGIADALEDWGFWHSGVAPLLVYPGEELAVVPVPNPAELAIGIPSVAEAAALRGAMELSAGGRVEMAVEKVKGAAVTVAAARVLPRGRLALVGLGPGDADERTPRAEAELRRASVVVGSEECVAQVRHLLRPGTRVVSEGAVEWAEAGAAVAYVARDFGPQVEGPVRAEVVRVAGVGGAPAR